MSKTIEKIRQLVTLQGLPEKKTKSDAAEALRSLIEKPGRTRIGQLSGKKFWRSLEELSETEEFEHFVHREFPEQASEFNDPVGRRGFLKLMAASLAFAGLTACTRQPTEYIYPYVRQPEGLIPGKPLFFATAFSVSGIAQGLLVESHEGRPTKIEGNPDHPANMGATDVFAQASILTLYDPDRSQTLTKLGVIKPYATFLGELQQRLADKKANKGAGLRILTETVTSPTLASQLKSILNDYPQAKWHQYEPVGRDSVRNGAKLAFGQDVNTIYRFDNADVVLSLDSDFLACGAGSVRYARDFASRRRPTIDKPEMSRLYVVESTPTGTGAKADHRLPVRASDIEAFTRQLALGLGVNVGQSLAAPYVNNVEWTAALARDLQAHRGKSIIIAGDDQPPVVHAMAHAFNQALGNVGSTVFYTESIEVQPVDQMASLRELVNDMNNHAVDMLIIIGGNPAYNAPADLGFQAALDNLGSGNGNKEPFRVHLSLYNDETSAYCDWHIPEAHYLESWSDARSYDGTTSIVQPLIAPLYRGKSAHELLAGFSNTPEMTGYDIVRNYWKTQMTGDFEDSWRKALNDGIIPNTAAQPKTVALSGSWTSQPVPSPAQNSQGQIEIVFKADPTIYDGRFANNGWLQELAKPLTKLTWENAALMSPATA